MADRADLPCPTGHEMMSTTLGDLKSSPSAAKYAGGFECWRCHRRVVSIVDRVCHCQTCETDFCDSCSAQMVVTLECDSGHPLAPTYAGDVATFRRGYTCSHCHNHVSLFPVRRCPRCSFDLCPACVATRLGFPPHPSAAVAAAAAPARPPAAATTNLAMTGDWKQVFTDAGLTEGQLFVEPSRSAIFDAVRNMYPPARRPPAPLTWLPPIADLPRTTREISAALRQAVRASVPCYPIGAMSEMPMCMTEMPAR